MTPDPGFWEEFFSKTQMGATEVRWVEYFRRAVRGGPEVYDHGKKNSPDNSLTQKIHTVRMIQGCRNKENPT